MCVSHDQCTQESLLNDIIGAEQDNFQYRSLNDTKYSTHTKPTKNLISENNTRSGICILVSIKYVHLANDADRVLFLVFILRHLEKTVVQKKLILREFAVYKLHTSCLRLWNDQLNEDCLVSVLSFYNLTKCLKLTQGN